MATSDPLGHQVGGDHYQGGSIQPIEFIQANALGFIEGSVVKYVSRWRKKNGLEDLLKARHYLDILIAMERVADDPPVVRDGAVEESRAAAGLDRPASFTEAAEALRQAVYSADKPRSSVAADSADGVKSGPWHATTFEKGYRR